MAPIEVDYFNSRTEKSIHEYEIDDDKTEVIDNLPPAKLVLKVDKNAKRGELKIEGNIQYINAFLFKDDQDEEGVSIDPSCPIYFYGSQVVEVESLFRDEMYAFRYLESKGNILISEINKLAVKVPA